ncbi:DUF2461 domain-containing protein [Sinomicrobium weinanense]|uniref:DUF2461 domain-containing protein n=1 Tax=Sinomicrobium weinanense TaxID=2842200 RepID=A0A926Q0F2_9FLAO|nr:DUF2461 domain-containing protein [Sinomicrobium weinanense]MBC9794872.1 DUF2461 domain-containing protein [Sinomicrobium weinanense]MBU3125643.1 DUF2461 domain-containing protein [Sinomicrobium weinanense]
MISKETLTFLKELKTNNDRDWFNENKKRFKAAEAEIKNTGNIVFEKMKMHDALDRVKLFRIYRDVRFSANKQPYKTHFGLSFHRQKPEFRGGYYLHIEPKNSFMATGFWQPEKNDLHRIRKEIEMDDSEMKEIINDETFQSVWGQLKGEEVKTAPKGFNRDHPAIDLIRKKQYIFTKNLTDNEVLSKDFPELVDQSFRAIRPYFDYMSEVLTTDLNGVSMI